MEEKNDKIDLRKFFKTVFSHKLLFFIVLTLATGLGVYISFCIPKEYTTTVVLAPESSEVSGSDLSSLASMVGVRLGSSSNNDAFYPQIYPSLFDSNDFIIPLWKTNVETIDGKVKTNLYDYVLHHRTAPWWSIYIDKLSKKFLPKPVVGKKKGKNEVDKFHLSQEQTDACNAIKGMMKCNVDQKTDVITIDVTTQDAKVAALVADTVLNYLQNFIIEYRTNKAKNDLQYVEGIYSEAKDTYESARRKYAAFCDANQEVELPSLQSEMEEMENDMQLKYTNYTQLQQQLQMAQAKLRERTPSFTVIQSATVALKKSKPKRMIIVGLFFAVAFFGTYLVAARLEDKKKDKKKVVKEEIVPNDSEEPIEV